MLIAVVIVTLLYDAFLDVHNVGLIIHLSHCLRSEWYVFFRLTF